MIGFTLKIIIYLNIYMQRERERERERETTSIVSFLAVDESRVQSHVSVTLTRRLV